MKNFSNRVKAEMLSGVALAIAEGDSKGGAYDANDPADKAIVDGLIEEALEAEREKHEAEITGLKTKNADLVKRLGRARAGNAEGGNTEEITRLERELEETSGKLATAEADLREATRQLKKVTGERDNATRSLETESSFSRNMLIENGLTSALTEANVDPALMEAAKALLGKGATVKVEGDNRTAVVGDKPLGEFVKEWAASDAAKRFILAPVNGGGGAPPQGGGGNPGTKKLADMLEPERLAMARTNPTGWAALLAAEGPNANNPVPPVA